MFNTFYNNLNYIFEKEFRDPKSVTCWQTKKLRLSKNILKLFCFSLDYLLAESHYFHILLKGLSSLIMQYRNFHGSFMLLISGFSGFSAMKSLKKVENQQKKVENG